MNTLKIHPKKSELTSQILQSIPESKSIYDNLSVLLEAIIKKTDEVDGVFLMVRSKETYTKRYSKVKNVLFDQFFNWKDILSVFNETKKSFECYEMESISSVLFLFPVYFPSFQQ